MVRRSKKIANPLFDEIDSDLGGLAWRLTNKGYAKRSQNYRQNGVARCRVLLAHRVVLERILGRRMIPGEVCDHINHARLDCRRSNLRLATIQQNSQHRAYSPNRGTTLHKKTMKWQGYVIYQNKYFYCGLYVKRIDAAIAAARKRVELGFVGSDVFLDRLLLQADE